MDLVLGYILLLLLRSPKFYFGVAIDIFLGSFLYYWWPWGFISNSQWHLPNFYLFHYFHLISIPLCIEISIVITVSSIGVIYAWLVILVPPYPVLLLGLVYDGILVLLASSFFFYLYLFFLSSVGLWCLLSIPCFWYSYCSSATFWCNSQFELTSENAWSFVAVTDMDCVELLASRD